MAGWQVTLHNTRDAVIQVYKVRAQCCFHAACCIELFTRRMARESQAGRAAGDGGAGAGV